MKSTSVSHSPIDSACGGLDFNPTEQFRANVVRPETVCLLFAYAGIRKRSANCAGIPRHAEDQLINQCSLTVFRGWPIIRFAGRWLNPERSHFAWDCCWRSAAFAGQWIVCTVKREPSARFLPTKFFWDAPEGGPHENIEEN